MDEILNVANKYKNQFIFSSFNLEIVVYLSLVQNKYPVYLLADPEYFNLPSQKIDEAMLNFCLRYNLKGIVFDSNAEFTNLKKQIELYRTNNLEVLFYGDKINLTEFARQYFEFGVTGLIVDNALGITAGLK